MLRPYDDAGGAIAEPRSMLRHYKRLDGHGMPQGCPN